MSTRIPITTCAWMVLMLAVPASPAHAQDPAGHPGARHEPPGGGTAGASVPAANLHEDARADGAERTKPWSRGVPQAQRARARELFLEGNRYLDVPLFAQAAEKYQEALALWPHPAFHFNLALAQLNLVQPVEAYESFGQALAHAPDGIAEDKQRLAQDYRQRLEQQLGRIEVTCQQPGAAVTMDGRPLFTAPGRWEGVMLPGEHQILASADGFIPAAERVVVSAGERSAVALVLHKPERTMTVRYMPAWIPWASLGVGAAVLGVGRYVEQRADQKTADFNQAFRDKCPRGCEREEAPELYVRLDDAQSERRNALRLYMTGAAVLTMSAALLYVNRERVVRRGALDDTVSLIPVLAPDAAGMSARIRF